MKNINVSEAMKLIQAKTPLAVSIYLGTNIHGKHAQGAIKENLLGLYRSVERSIKMNHRGSYARRLLHTLKTSLSSLRPKRSRGGLGIFHMEGFTGVLNIPTPVTDLAVAADSFHLKPVLKLQQLRRSYYLLAFGKKHVCLYKVSADKTEKLESVGYGSPDDFYSDEGNSPYHPIRIRRREDLADFMEAINSRMELYWKLERLPLLLAGNEFHQSLFRDSCSYVNLCEAGMNGDVTGHSTESLTHISSLFMERYFSAYDEKAINGFKLAQVRGTGTNQLQVIAKEAIRGNVKHLLVAEDRHLWGRLDRGSGQVRLVTDKLTSGTDDVLDDLAEITLQGGGLVTVLPSVLMPEGYPIAAILDQDSPRENAYVLAEQLRIKHRLRRIDQDVAKSA